VIYAKMMFGGLGRRGFEAISAAMVLTFAIAIVVTGFMILAGSRDALLRAERSDRPDVVHVKGRYNRALFETPRSGNLPPLTLPVYEPLVSPAYEPSHLRTHHADRCLIDRAEHRRRSGAGGSAASGLSP
jgi:hypothetical protein